MDTDTNTTDTAAFDAQLARDGYADVDTRTLAPALVNAPHSHPFDVRALMLAGELTLTVAGESRTYRAGDVFTMSAGCEHAERFGAEGATYRVGRRRAG